MTTPGERIDALGGTGGVSGALFLGDATVTETDATAIGSGAASSGDSAVAIGKGATAVETWATAIGFDSRAFGGGSTAIGPNATADGQFSTCIGAYAESQEDYSICIKAAVTASSYTAQTNHVVLHAGSFGNDNILDIDLSAESSAVPGTQGWRIPVSVRTNGTNRGTFYLALYN
jgi:autotransporter adhesin